MSYIESILEALPEVIFGAEGDETGGTSTEGEPGDPATLEDGTDPDAESDKDKDKGDGALTALRAERKLKREAEAEARRLKAENEALKRKDLEEVDRLKAELGDATTRDTETQSKLQKLTDGFRTSAVKTALMEEAKKQKFIDVNDALDGVDYSTLAVEQDEEDPTQVTIDLKTVTAAVKKLATSKPHYINKGTDDGDATGSSFGGSRNKGGTQTSEEKLKGLYPNL